MEAISVFELSYLIGFSFGAYHFHARSRQRMMFMKVLAAIFISYYFWGMGAQTALIACIISGLGGASQGLFKDELLEKTKTIRCGVAIFLACAGIFITASNSLEALPLIATIISRFSEVQACRQRIRMGYLLSQICWVCYAISSGFMILYIAENFNMLSNLFAIWNHEQARKKYQLIPVRSLDLQSYKDTL